MKASDSKELKNRILKLAKMHAIGTPAQLACVIGVSKSSLNRIIADIRSEGITIPYSRVLESYILD